MLGASQRAQVAHHAFIKRVGRGRKIARHHLRHAVLHFQAFGASRIAAAAMAAIFGFGESFIYFIQPVPAIAHFVHVVIMNMRGQKVINKAHLHTGLNFGFAAQFGFRFALAFFAHQATARAAHALPHAAHVGGNRFACAGKRLDNGRISGGLDFFAVNHQCVEFFAHGWVPVLSKGLF